MPIGLGRMEMRRVFSAESFVGPALENPRQIDRKICATVVARVSERRSIRRNSGGTLNATIYRRQ